MYLRELEKLQDQIPPFPSDDAFAVIQLELGQPPAGLFSELGASTIAAASLGQVHGSQKLCRQWDSTSAPAPLTVAERHHCCTQPAWTTCVRQPIELRGGVDPISLCLRPALL
jgi:ABC1 atypical kinase-like domain